MANDRSPLAGEAIVDAVPAPTGDAPAVPSGSATRATSPSPAALPGAPPRKTLVTLPDGSRVIGDYGADGGTLADQRVYDASGALVLFKLFDASGRTLRATATDADGSTSTSVYTSGVLTKTFAQATDGSRTVDDYNASGTYVLDRRTYDATGALTGFTSLGPNGHNPVVTEAAGTPASGADLVETGSIAFAAPAAAGAHTASVSFDAAASGAATPLGTLVPVVAGDTAGGAAGEVDWTYVVPASQVESLSVGQSGKQVFDVTLTDQHGGTLVRPVAVLLAGTDDAPAPATTAGDSASGAVSDTPNAPKSPYGYYTATGTLSFTDPDLKDVHDVSSVDPVYFQPYFGSWSAQLVQDSTGGATGRYRWTYSVSLQQLQSLAPGETATQDFQFRVTDAHGGELLQTVSVTLTGTADHAINHAPDIAFGAQSRPVIEAGVGTAGTASATIAVTASDRDPGDGATLQATGWTRVDAAHVTKDGTYGSAVLDLGTGVITYTLDDTRAVTDALVAGQTASDSFAVTDRDTHGLTTTQNANFAVTGTDDAPAFVSEVTDASFGSVVGLSVGASPVFLPDSTRVAFGSSSNLVPGDTNGEPDVFIEDLTTGAVTRVSTTADGAQANGSQPSFSADGTKVAFLTTASDLLPAGIDEGVVVKDLVTGTVTPVLSTVGASSTAVSIGTFALSPDGSEIAFDSESADLIPDDTDGVSDVFVADLATGAITRVSITSTGEQLGGTLPPDGDPIYFAATAPVWSPDGTVVAFSTPAEDYGGDFYGPGLMLKNIETGALKDLGSGVDEDFSHDGTKITYTSLDPNIPDSSPGSRGVSVTDLESGSTTGLNLYGAGFVYNGTSDQPVFLPDGKSIAFVSNATDVDTDNPNTPTNVFIEELSTGAITRVSTAAGDVEADGSSDSPVVSPDGTKLIFRSGADNLVPGSNPGQYGVYLKDISDVLTATPALAVTDDGHHAVVSATGRLLFTDAEASDSHTLVVISASGDLGTLAATQARDSTGRLTGVIDLTYQVTHAAASAALRAGQARTDAFTVTVDDGHGGTAQQAVSVALAETGPGSAAATSTAFAASPGVRATTSADHPSDGSSPVQVEGPHAVDSRASGPTPHTDQSDAFESQGDQNTSYVFDPGHGLDVVQQFHVGGADHDAIDLPSSDVADVLRDTHNAGGSAIITSPTSSDTVRLAGIAKAELKAHRGDLVFHP